MNVELEDLEEVAPEPLAVRAETRRLPDPAMTLGIETSCDETAVSVLRGEREILSNVIASQISVHERYGGIVPELASRAHVRAINPVLARALQEADVTLWDLSVISVTVGPGLIGSLVVGMAAAKALAAVLEAPLVGVNHLEAHLYSNILHDPEASPPALGLIVSGGHTLLVNMRDHGVYDLVGQTLDDAAGEAFDKIARFLGLGFPGGPAIEKTGATGDPAAISFPRPMLEEGLDFSFSGLKTAVLNHVRREEQAGRPLKVEDVCASFQEAVVDVLVKKSLRAALAQGARALFLSGGVAANSRLREALSAACEPEGIRLFYPPLSLCTDNAAMVACCGFHRFRRGIRSDSGVSADPNLSLV